MQRQERDEIRGRTASGIVLAPVVSYARSLGLDIEALLREARIDGAKIGDPDYRVPEASRQLLWQRLPALSNDPNFGLNVPKHATLGVLDVVDYALCFSATIGEALERFVRFSRILSDALAMDVIAKGDTVTFERTTHVTAPHEQDAVFALMALRVGEISEAIIHPRSVSFVHAEPASNDAYTSLFSCPVWFRAPACAIAFDVADLARPVRQATPQLVAVLDRHASDLLARLPNDSTYTSRARAAVVRALAHGTPSLESIARAIHASPRTVQRRLEDEGTSHREVVDDVRRELATRYLRDPTLSITEISFLLGFADASSFRRAFHAWTGKSPKRAH